MGFLKDLIKNVYYKHQYHNKYDYGPQDYPGYGSFMGLTKPRPLPMIFRKKPRKSPPDLTKKKVTARKGKPVIKIKGAKKTKKKRTIEPDG